MSMWWNRTQLTPNFASRAATFSASSCRGKLAPNQRFTPTSRNRLLPLYTFPSPPALALGPVEQARHVRGAGRGVVPGEHEREHRRRARVRPAGGYAREHGGQYDDGKRGASGSHGGRASGVTFRADATDIIAGEFT